MSSIRLITASALLLAAGTLLSCAGRAKDPLSNRQGADVMGVYRVVLQAEEREPRKFRLLLFAAQPDRLHAEALSAVGSTELILDGGGGRISVALMRERTAYVGDAAPETIEKVLGVALSLEELVRILLTGEDGGGSFEMERIPERGIGLPQRLWISSEGRSAEFHLKRLRPVRARSELLGTGSAPERMKVLPLDELEALELPES